MEVTAVSMRIKTQSQSRGSQFGNDFPMQLPSLAYEQLSDTGAKHRHWETKGKNHVTSLSEIDLFMLVLKDLKHNGFRVWMGGVG